MMNPSVNWFNLFSSYDKGFKNFVFKNAFVYDHMITRQNFVIIGYCKDCSIIRYALPFSSPSRKIQIEIRKRSLT